MDRQIVYSGAIPLDTDLLNTNKNLMIGLGFALQAILGGTTVVDGLACTPTGPASQQVLVAQGSIYSTENVDGTAFGSLGSDTSHQILKQGLTALGNTAFTCAAPSTSGQSIAYLIQGEYQDIDGGSTVLPYYNASNPAVAFNGPANAGTSQNTVRQGKLVLNLKAGASATTGTQVTPTPDAGFTGLWVVTVANGITAITSGMIAQYPGAPFINYKLPQLSPSGAARSQLTTNTQFNVNASTGSDSTGTGASGAPWQTIQHAINVLSTYDLNGFTATIKCATGTYAPAIVSVPFLGGAVQLTGDTTTPTNCEISASSGGLNCIEVTGYGSALSVAGFFLTTSASAGGGIVAIYGGSVNVNGNMNYGAMASGNQHLSASVGALINVTANYTISASAFDHATAQNDGIIYLAGVTATLSGSPAFSNGFFWAQIVSLIWAVGYTVSGSGSGPAYTIAANAVVQMNGAGFTFTGASAGTTATGGIIV
jgi:hypothetical protein